jgi:hypothetical protein
MFYLEIISRIIISLYNYNNNNNGKSTDKTLTKKKSMNITGDSFSNAGSISLRF